MNPQQTPKEPKGADTLDATVRLSHWQEQNKWKNTNISVFPNSYANCVLLAAIDWKNFQSLENANALYMAVLKMLGEEPENIHMLDDEA